MAQNEWFTAWFNSKWYHLLYHNRDKKAAEKEVESLVSVLNLAPGARILDLACGKGRHAIHLAHLGYEVTGLDISYESIAYARKLEHAGLEFFQHDMRLAFRSNYYDAVMNMFTSIGYFDRNSQNQMAINHMATNLKKGGVLLLDFFNSQYVIDHLVPHEVKQVQDTVFDIKKELAGGFVHKTITFEAEGKVMIHREKVQLLTFEDFSNMFERAGLKMEAIYGDYLLAPFDLSASRRLIMKARKI
jgi:SAM-dependent methyltransferase